MNNLFLMDVGQSFEYTSQNLYFLFLVVKPRIDKFFQIDSVAKFHGDIQDFKRKHTHSPNNWRRLFRFLFICATLVDTRSFRKIHILPSIPKSNITIFIIFKHDSTVLYDAPFVAMLALWLEVYITWTIVSPSFVDFIQLLDLLLLVCKVHVFDYLGHWGTVLEPGLIVSHYVWMV